MTAQPGLTREELEFVLEGFMHWGGPAHPTEAFARELGIADLSTFWRELRRLRSRLEDDSSIDASDWMRILRLTETIVTDNTIGCGWEWTMVTPNAQPDTTRLLDSVREKLGVYR